MDTFRVLDANHVAYLDLGGSGNETQAHLSVDGRITIMFCAFDNPALIMRLYGPAMSMLPQDAGFADPPAPFQRLPVFTHAVQLPVARLMTSCGAGVPRTTTAHQKKA